MQNCEKGKEGQEDPETNFHNYKPECRVWQWHTQDNFLMPKKAHLGIPQMLKFLCLCCGTHGVAVYLNNFCMVFGAPAPKVWDCWCTQGLANTGYTLLTGLQIRY